jgi:hypothetical protein
MARRAPPSFPIFPKTSPFGLNWTEALCYTYALCGVAGAKIQDEEVTFCT